MNTWTASRYSSDSDGSLICRWTESFEGYETALRFVVSVIDREAADIIESCQASLDEGVTVEEVQNLYAQSDSIVIHRSTESPIRHRRLVVPFHLHALTDIQDDFVITVTWGPSASLTD